ncbi:MAG: hypothetical protein OXC66_14440, partial [Roseovarius sp.]|nr:hypothetical protein [Roseovarius sp.]
AKSRFSITFPHNIARGSSNISFFMEDGTVYEKQELAGMTARLCHVMALPSDDGSNLLLVPFVQGPHANDDV